MPLDNAKLARAVSTTEKLVKRMDALETRRKDDYGHPVKSNNRVQQTDYGRGDAVPSWPGADAVYSALGRIMKKLGESGGATPGMHNKKGKLISQGGASENMRRIASAMGKGDEETLKALKWEFRDYL